MSEVDELALGKGPLDVGVDKIKIFEFLIGEEVLDLILRLLWEVQGLLLDLDFGAP